MRLKLHKQRKVNVAYFNHTDEAFLKPKRRNGVSGGRESQEKQTTDGVKKGSYSTLTLSKGHVPIKQRGKREKAEGVRSSGNSWVNLFKREITLRPSKLRAEKGDEDWKREIGGKERNEIKRDFNRTRTPHPSAPLRTKSWLLSWLASGGEERWRRTQESLKKKPVARSQRVYCLAAWEGNLPTVNEEIFGIDECNRDSDKQKQIWHANSAY